MIEEFWKRSFNGCLPIAYELKYMFKERWVRFHALPRSKRYPETEEEYQEVFLRHNTVLNELTKSNNQVYLVGVAYSGSPHPSGIGEDLKDVLKNNRYWLSVPLHESGEGEEFHSYFHLYYEKVNWNNQRLNKLFRLVADEEVSNFMVVSEALGWVFHPYDGGADVILKDTDKRKELKEMYSEWLSKHPLGM